MNKELNEDARTKQDLLYECSNLKSRLSDEIIKNEHLEQQCKKLQEELKYTIGIVEHNRIISKKNKEIHQLKDNWNKLKEAVINDINFWEEQEKKWIELGFIKFGGEANNKIIFKKVLNKIQELQGSDSNE